MFRTIEEIKEANRRAGQFFFTKGAMRFFNSRIGNNVYGGYFFVTSETPGPDSPRRYTVRAAHDNGRIGTVGQFGEYGSSEAARSAARFAAAELQSTSRCPCDITHEEGEK